MHLCVLCGSQNKQRIFSLYSINLTVFKTKVECFLRGTNWVFKSDRYSFVLKVLILSAVSQNFTYATMSESNITPYFYNSFTSVISAYYVPIPFSTDCLAPILHLDRTRWCIFTFLTNFGNKSHCCWRKNYISRVIILPAFLHIVQLNAYAFLAFFLRATYRVDLVNHVLIMLVNVFVKETNCNFYYALQPYITFTFVGPTLSFRREKGKRERQKCFI